MDSTYLADTLGGYILIGFIAVWFRIMFWNIERRSKKECAQWEDGTAWESAKQRLLRIHKDDSEMCDDIRNETAQGRLMIRENMNFQKLFHEFLKSRQ